jgi:succinyl-diaminopimelate desuccinylase
VDARLLSRQDGPWSHPVMGPPTLNVGTIRGGENLNSVPDHAELTIDMRSIPGMPHAVVADQIADLLGEDASMTTEVDLPCVWSDTEHPVMRLFEQSHADATGEKPEWKSANFFTDASVFSPIFDGAQTVICGPGEPEMAHQTDEYCEVSKIGEAVEIYSRFLTQI